MSFFFGCLAVTFKSEYVVLFDILNSLGKKAFKLRMLFMYLCQLVYDKWKRVGRHLRCPKQCSAFRTLYQRMRINQISPADSNI